MDFSCPLKLFGGQIGIAQKQKARTQCSANPRFDERLIREALIHGRQGRLQCPLHRHVIAEAALQAFGSSSGKDSILHKVEYRPRLGFLDVGSFLGFPLCRRSAQGIVLCSRGQKGLPAGKRRSQEQRGGQSQDQPSGTVLGPGSGLGLLCTGLRGRARQLCLPQPFLR